MRMLAEKTPGDLFSQQELATPKCRYQAGLEP